MVNDNRALSFDVGGLQATTKIRLHTHQAARQLFNRSAEGGRGYSMGLTTFMNRMSQIHHASADDDPYADWIMLLVEEKIKQTKERLKAMREDLKELLTQLPEGFTMDKTHSSSPFQMEIHAMSPLAYQTSYLMLDFDEYVANVMQLRHIGLIPTKRGRDLIAISTGLIRSLLTTVLDYRSAGVSRDDMAGNNARARAAIAKYGLPPKDILEGTRRSEFAPILNRIKRGDGAKPTSDVGTDNGDRGTGATSSHVPIAADVFSPVADPAAIDPTLAPVPTEVRRRRRLKETEAQVPTVESPESQESATTELDHE